MNEFRYAQLVQAITKFDANDHTAAKYNRYALPQYLARLEEIRADVDSGRSLRSAIIAGFCGRLQHVCLRAVGEPASTLKERQGVYRYTPEKKGA